MLYEINEFITNRAFLKVLNASRGQLKTAEELNRVLVSGPTSMSLSFHTLSSSLSCSLQYCCMSSSVVLIKQSHVETLGAPRSTNKTVPLLFLVCFWYEYTVMWCQMRFHKIQTGIISEDLKAFLEVTLPKVKAGKKPAFKVGVSEPKIGAAILEVSARHEENIPFWSKGWEGKVWVERLLACFLHILVTLLVVIVTINCFALIGSLGNT